MGIKALSWLACFIVCFTAYSPGFEAEGKIGTGSTKGAFELYPPDQKPSLRPTNVILLIGDGLGAGQLETARLLEHGRDGRLFLESLPYTALVHTPSANNHVTDSAAAATALATGRKTNNGMIGVLPDGQPVTSILDQFKQTGRRTGVISTNMVTDATPSAFTASVPDRWSGHADIARQQFRNQVDVLLGGGRDHFGPGRQDGEDLIKQFVNAGYAYAENRDEMLEAGGDQLLGLFHPEYMTFASDRKELKSKEPSLSEMTRKAIEILSKEEKGFFLMAEGAKIDHAAHAGDLTGIWRETIDFDEAVRTAVEWAGQRRDTLVLVTADHETYGISATEPLDTAGLKRIHVSAQLMAERLRNSPMTDADILRIFKEFAGISLRNEELAEFKMSISRMKGKMYSSQRLGWEIGSVIARRNMAGTAGSLVRENSRTTGGHSANPVILFAVGPGADRFSGVLDNTDIPKKIAKLVGFAEPGKIEAITGESKLKHNKE